jgi:hypothetical protein
VQGVHRDEGYQRQGSGQLERYSGGILGVSRRNSQVQEYCHGSDHEEQEHSGSSDVVDGVFFGARVLYVRMKNHQDICDMLQESDQNDTHHIKKCAGVVMYGDLRIACLINQRITNDQVQVPHDTQPEVIFGFERLIRSAIWKASDKPEDY